MTNHLLGGDMDMTRDEYSKMRGSSVREVSATHGTAHLALFDDATWEKYQLTKLAGQKFKSNTLIKESSAAKADAKNFEDAFIALATEAEAMV